MDRFRIRLSLLVILMAFGASASAATFTVNSTGDQSDDTPGDGVCETLLVTGPGQIELIQIWTGMIWVL